MANKIKAIIGIVTASLKAASALPTKIIRVTAMAIPSITFIIHETAILLN